MSTHSPSLMIPIEFFCYGSWQFTKYIYHRIISLLLSCVLWSSVAHDSSSYLQVKKLKLSGVKVLNWQMRYEVSSLDQMHSPWYQTTCNSEGSPILHLGNELRSLLNGTVASHSSRPPTWIAHGSVSLYFLCGSLWVVRVPSLCISSWVCWTWAIKSHRMDWVVMYWGEALNRHFTEDRVVSGAKRSFWRSSETGTFSWEQVWLF